MIGDMFLHCTPGPQFNAHITKTRSFIVCLKDRILPRKAGKIASHGAAVRLPAPDEAEPDDETVTAHACLYILCSVSIGKLKLSFHQSVLCNCKTTWRPLVTGRAPCVPVPVSRETSSTRRPSFTNDPRSYPKLGPESAAPRSNTAIVGWRGDAGCTIRSVGALRCALSLAVLPSPAAEWLMGSAGAP